MAARRWADPRSCKTGKAAFRTQGDALRALDRIHRANLQALVPLPTEPQSVYRCPECGAWHLTRSKDGVHVS